MEILENHTVRHLELVLNNEERKRYSSIMFEFIERRIHTHTQQSGPMVDKNLRVVPNEFLIIIDIQEEYADEFLNRVKEG